MEITKADFNNAQIADLLRTHIERARAQTAPGSTHALDLAGLQSPDVQFWAMWDGLTLVAIGALKRLTAQHGEVKSMHVAASRRRSGAGSAMLRHIIAAAKEMGMSRLSLETGSWPYFRPAHALYRKHGFVGGRPFDKYREDPNSLFFHLDLSGPADGGGPAKASAIRSISPDRPA